MIHELKCYKTYYQDVIDQKKKFEIRKEDRKDEQENDLNFQAGDYLDLNEVDEADGCKPTGRSCRVLVTHVLKDCPEFGLMEGFAILSIFLTVSPPMGFEIQKSNG